MTLHDPIESQLDELEALVIQTARRSRTQDLPKERATLEAVRRRIAALPITGLPKIDISDIPTTSPTTFITGASGKAAAVVKGAAATQALPSIPMTVWFTVGHFKLAATAIAIAGSAAIGTNLIPAERAAHESTAPQEIPVDEGQAHAMPNTPRNQKSLIESKKTAVQAAPKTHLATNPVPVLNLPDTRLGAPISFERSSSLSHVPDAPLDAPIVFERSSGDPSRSTQTSEKLAEVSPERPQTPTLTGELEQLRRAQQALQKGEPARALQAMLDLDQKASGGALYPERQIIKVLALCALGRNTEAESLAQRLSASSGGAVYTSRLKNSCVSPSTIVDQ